MHAVRGVLSCFTVCTTWRPFGLPLSTASPPPRRLRVELVQRQEYLDTTIAKNIPNIFNLITRRSERLQKRRAGGRRPPAAQLSLWLQWGHRTKRIDMHRTRTGHHDGNRRRTTTTQPQTSSRAVTRAVTHATYISSMRAVNSTMRLRNTRPTAGTAVLPAGERTPHAPRSSASHR